MRMRINEGMHSKFTKFKKVCDTVLEMATQNVAPPAHSGSRKGKDASQSGLKDGQSVTKRLQQDLMTLMVSGASK